jgi:hypothetical protein
VASLPLVAQNVGIGWWRTSHGRIAARCFWLPFDEIDTHDYCSFFEKSTLMIIVGYRCQDAVVFSSRFQSTEKVLAAMSNI